MYKLIRATAIVVFSVTTAVWVYALTQHTFLLKEFWIYVGIFLVPGIAVCLSLWLMRLRKWWWKLIGTIFMIATGFFRPAQGQNLAGLVVRPCRAF